MRKLEELCRLDGRVALVTGGEGHIGSAICDALEEWGATVVSADKAPERGERRSDSATDRLYRSVDLANPDAAAGLVEDVLGETQRLDILVHSAAFVGTTDRPGWNVPFSEQSPEIWDEALRVNLTAAFALAQAARPALSESGRGSVVLVSSIYGMVGPDLRLYDGTAMNNIAAYAASKGGVLQLTRYLATVLAPAVRVNALTPGGVWRGQPDTFVERYVERTPMGRMASEEDLKGAAAYLASDLSAYVTGQNLVVDGGWTAW